MKVVINGCFGGFGLSHKAIMRYAELKGFELFPFTDRRDANGNLDFASRTFVPYDGGDAFIIHYSRSPLTEQGTYDNDAYFSDGDIDRNDPILIHVVNEMGDAANGRCADLEVVEIPDDVKWHIEEYDGNEHVAEDHRTWP